MKKIVIASDSFKGSLSSAQVAESAAKAIMSVMPACRVVGLPVADGGEGTCEAYIAAVGGIMIAAQVHDPLMRVITAEYGITADGETAVIDTAAASGLALLTPAERDPLGATTFGTGELILDALRHGCRRIILGTGGSATNDAGKGILRALGYRFVGEYGKEAMFGGGPLGTISEIDASGTVQELSGAEIIIAYDVDVPFYGPGGATEIFAPQKGADPETIRELDAGMKHFAGVLERQFGRDPQTLAGSGSAGGAAGTLAVVLGAELICGSEFILGAVGLANHLADADLVITGEGRMDAQTLSGKAPYGVLKAATIAGVPAIGVTGDIADREKLLSAGFTDIYSINPEGADLTEALEPARAAANVERTAARIVRDMFLSEEPQ